MTAVSVPAENESDSVVRPVLGEIRIVAEQDHRLVGARLGPPAREVGRWDRDRIDAFYRRSGYLTERVTTTRNEADGQVTLEYQIAPGPKTSIMVSGLDVDAALRSRLEQAWSDAVYDEFLIDEAVCVIKERLSTDTATG